MSETFVKARDTKAASDVNCSSHTHPLNTSLPYPPSANKVRLKEDLGAVCLCQLVRVGFAGPMKYLTNMKQELLRSTSCCLRSALYN